MRIALFGASGRTGRRVMVEARRRGHDVIAVSRHPPEAAPPRVTWRRADARVRAQVDAALTGADAVVVCLGPRQLDDASMAGATRTIIDAMRARGIPRLACQTGALIGHAPGRLGWLLRRMKRSFRARHPAAAADRTAQERAVVDSGLDFTLVRPTRLTEGAATARLVATDARVPSLAVSRRDDVAATLLDAVEGRHRGEAVVVLSRPPIGGRLHARWTATYAVGEMLGLGLVGAIMTATRGLTDGAPAAALAIGGLAGVVEGLIVGGLLGALLVAARPELRLRTWLVGTVLGALVAWALGALPAALADDDAAAPALGWVLVGAAGLGLAAGPILGGAQSWALRAVGVRGRTWIVANALGWAIGMPLVFLAAGQAWTSVAIVARGALLLGLAGAAVGWLTGRALARDDRAAASATPPAAAHP